MQGDFHDYSLNFKRKYQNKTVVENFKDSFMTKRRDK